MELLYVIFLLFEMFLFVLILVLSIAIVVNSIRIRKLSIKLESIETTMEHNFKNRLKREIKNCGDQHELNTINEDIPVEDSVDEALLENIASISSPDTAVAVEVIRTVASIRNIYDDVITSGNASDHFQKEFSNNTFESFVGMRVLNILGAIAVILGMGFFIKYAFDNSWVTPVMQIMIGYLVGAGLVFGGKYFFKINYRTFSQGLTGSGIAILYFTTFAASDYYQLMSGFAAIFIMLSITIASYYLSYKYNSVAICFLAMFGGYVTPFILSSEYTNVDLLLGYLFFINIFACMIIARKPEWRLMEIINLVVTALIFMSLSFFGLFVEHSSAATIFLAGIWFLYSFSILSRSYRQPENFTALDITTFGTNIFFFIVNINYTMDGINNSNSAIGSILLTVALLSFASMYFMTNKFQKNKPMSEKLGVIQAIIFVGLAIMFIFHGYYEVLVLAIFSLGILCCGTRLARSYFINLSLTGFILCTFKLLTTYGYFAESSVMPFFNIRDLTTLVFISIIFIALKEIKWISSHINRQIFESVIIYISNLLILLFIILEIQDIALMISRSSDIPVTFLDFHRNMLQVIALSFYSIVCLKEGLIKKASEYLVTGSLIIIVVIIMILIAGYNFDLSDGYIFLLNIRTIAFISIIAGLMLSVKWLKLAHYDKDIESVMVVSANILVCFLLFIFLSYEMKDIFNNYGSALELISGHYILAGSAKSLCLSGIWLIYSIILILSGIHHKLKEVRIFAIAILALSIFKISVIDLAFLDVPYRIASFIFLGMILILASYYYQKYSDIITGKKLTPTAT